ncbi:AI-2E family transporter [Microbacterium sp. AGC85]
MATSSRGESANRHLHGIRLLVVLACSVVALAGLHLARSVVGPLAVAVVIVVVCLPVREAIVKRGGARSLGTASIIALSYSVIAVAGVAIWLAGAQLAQLISDLTPGGDLGHVMSTWTTWVQAVSHVSSDDGVSGSVQIGGLLVVLRDVSAVLLGALIALLFVCAYVVVMAVDAGRYSRAPMIFGTSQLEALARVSALNHNVRRYYVVNSAFGAVVAIIDGLALWALGVPAAFMWAVLAFVTNFIPTIGFVIGLVPPAILALAIGGWPLFLVVVGIYCVVNVVLQVFVQPKFVSDAVGLSLTLSFFSVIFWTFIVGPVGAVLAIPLTLLVWTLLLEGDDEASWLRWLSGDDSAQPGQQPATVRERSRMPWRRRGYPRRHAGRP